MRGEGPLRSHCFSDFTCTGPWRMVSDQHISCREGRHATVRPDPRTTESTTLGAGPEIHFLGKPSKGF